MRYAILATALLLGAAQPARAQVSVGIAAPGVSIGINLPVYPELVLVPGYPVYYAPAAEANYFFYDGLYWVYARDAWYASSWYNGPWRLVRPDRVPLYVLRVPVRYYRVPPPYFRGWQPEQPPRWGEHWGRGWERRHAGWDRWDRHGPPQAAPLPVYQRDYAGERYPHAPGQQRQLRVENYRHEPREWVTRQQFRQQPAPPAAQPRPGQPERQHPGQGNAHGHGRGRGEERGEGRGEGRR